MTEEQKKQLEQRLWDIANILRGRMNADEFRDYILGFIFYKHLSEKMESYGNNMLAHEQEKISYTELDENNETHFELLDAIKVEAVEGIGYFLKPSELFHSLVLRGKLANEDGTENEDDTQELGDNNVLTNNTPFILEDLKNILSNIERSTMGNESEEDFVALFEDLDLTSSKLGRTEKEKNLLVVKVLRQLDKIDFRLEDSNADVLGNAYEYLIGEFASSAGKKAGEFYTPQQVSKILAKIVATGKNRLKSVYDPTCGSGSLLLRVAKEVGEVVDFYGQELNRTTYNLCRMNMILHNVHYNHFSIKQEDTLTRPQHKHLKPFEAIVANPPFSAKWSANKIFETDERFAKYGKLAPASKADFAFVQHMLYHLADNGQMAVILPHGALFRGAAEGHIRRFIIEELNQLDAVIGLPANIFYGTSIPACILAFKACREHADDILFIDASNDYESGKNQNILRDSDVEKIISTYRNRTEIPKYSYRATMREIAENEYNLNIPRYVNTLEEEELIDIELVAAELKQLGQQVQQHELEIAKYCAELGIPTPF